MLRRRGMCESAIATLTLAWAVTANAGETCVPVENGSFAAGLDGWTTTPVEQTSGAAGASATASLFDGSDYISFSGEQLFDESVLRLDVFATAGANGEIGQALAEITASREAIVTRPTLRVLVGGGFEYLFFGSIERSLEAVVEVTGPNRETALAVIHSSAGGEPAPGCRFGLSLLGTLDADPPHFEIDLAAAGIEIGDPVQIVVTFRAVAETVDPCQTADTFGSLLIDQFEFCDAPGEPADINGDGHVNAADLALLLGSWTVKPGHGCDGVQPGCPADLNDDGNVNAADLALLLGAWTG